MSETNKLAKIENREITEELKDSYLDYAMSVIVSRALPDVRDGLKPVQRRILWTMWDSGLLHTAKYRKSANVVGETLGRYHPHGDTAVYDALVRMAQPFSLRYPLVQGQGNFGSVDGDSAAAMRYCITGETLVATNKGLTSIKDIAKEKSEDINISVLSRDRTINQAVKWFDSGIHPTLKITTKRGFSLQGSHNHPILTFTKNQLTGNPEFKWKLLNGLRTGDIAVIDRTPDLLWPEKNIDLTSYWPSPHANREQKILPKELNESLASILGAFIAEGTIKENEIEFCNSDVAWINKLENQWHEVFPDCRLHRFERKPNSYGKKPYQTLEIHSRQVIHFLRNIGLESVKSKNKTIPALILQSPKPVVAAFLKAYFEGDGGVSSSGRMIELSCCSKSETLITQLHILLLRFGIAATKRFDNYREMNKLYLRGLRNYRLFKEQIGFISENKNEKLNAVLAKLHKEYSASDYVPFLQEFVRNNLHDDQKWDNKEFTFKHNFDRYANMAQNYKQTLTSTKPSLKQDIQTLFESLLRWNYLFDPIIKIENGSEEKVYSIKVDSKCHSFVGGGFINHNTEARLSKIAEELLTDIEKETIPWQPNYDASRREPKVLPAKVPNLLINGTVGIAVGMATNIPPHNLDEVVAATQHLIEYPDATIDALMKFISGPDFPTGGTIFDKSAIKKAYTTGRGGVTCRAVAEIEERKNGFNIIVTEIPYQVNKAELIIKIANLVTDKKIEGIRDLRDESDREGMRIVIELKNDAMPQKVLNQLYKHTDLQKDFHFNMIALMDGIQPKLLNLKEILQAYIDHRRSVVERRAQFDLKKAKEREHILLGLVKALGVIDKIIATIKKSSDRQDAHKNLVKQFKLSDIQANAILDMRLQSLAALERKKLEEELKEKKKFITELETLLKSTKKMLVLVKDELGDIQKSYSSPRKTKQVAGGLKEFREEDLIAQEEVVITMSKSGYIKRVTPTSVRAQRRGGKGLIGSELGEEDFIEHFIGANTHDNMLYFTDRGRVFQSKAYEIPAGTRTTKGKLIQNFLSIPNDEHVTSLVAYPETKEGEKAGFVVMVTRRGMIKKIPLEDFANVRRSGIIAITLQKGDELEWAHISSGNDEVLIATVKGQAIRFKESQLRPTGRSAAGVRGIKVKANDVIAGLDIIRKDLKSEKLLVVTERGFAKQTPLSQYKVQSRGGQGIKTANISEKTGGIVNATIVVAEEQLLALSIKGQIIRTDISGIRTAGRVSSGVRIMRLGSGDKVAGAVLL